ncbi:MAG TPA: hypothetical protein VM843_09165 [Flavisolibacter sp.]|jgi:hypothetical protein|nr:hypothetical protein [Flavisolibacter sp.]
MESSMKYIVAVISLFSLLPASGQGKLSVKQQLEGRWISEDDRQFQILFKGNTKQDFYGKQVESTYRYRVNKDSLIAADVNSGDVFNYTILGLTQKSLKLMYLERGNLLKFRKQVNASTGPVKKRAGK